MRKFFASIAVVAQVALLSGCAAAWQGVTYADDLYAIHNKKAIAERQKAEAELAKAQYEAQQAQYEATLAQIKAEAAKQGFTVTEDAVINGYDAVLADSYESAYARRLYGFSSPTYRMPSSYYTWRYSDAFDYASAYDPAFYNVMVSGDLVWVEPKYITSMFGSWGAVAVPSYSWYYGWGSPYYYWNMPYYRWNYNWYWGCNYPHYRAHYHHHHHYRPHRPSYHRPSHHKPPYAGSGSVGNTGHHHNRPGMVVGRNPVASKPADRGGSVRPSQSSTGRTSVPSYRSGSSSSSRPQYSSGSSSYRSGSSSSSSSYRSSGSSSSRSSSYSGGGGSHSSGGSYSGGGNSRGR